MEIKTKYNIGDKVWWLGDHKVLSGIIHGIHFHHLSDKFITIDYTIKCIEVSIIKNVKEEYLFLSKEELLVSL